MGSYHWPPGGVRDESIDAFVSAFGTLGYSLCEDAGTEPGVQKIAVQAKGAWPNTQ
jgi:hypothetical protein